MPAVSGSPTQISSDYATADSLQAASASQFKPGDLAYVEDAKGYYTLTKSNAQVDGSRFLYTKESNPANGGSGDLRWELTNISGISEANIFGYAELSSPQTCPVQTPGNIYLPLPLLSVTLPPSKNVKAYFIEFSASGATAGASTVRFDLSIDGVTAIGSVPNNSTTAGAQGNGPVNASLSKRFEPAAGWDFAVPHTFTILWGNPSATNLVPTSINPGTLGGTPPTGQNATLRVTPLSS